MSDTATGSGPHFEPLLGHVWLHITVVSILHGNKWDFREAELLNQGDTGGRFQTQILISQEEIICFFNYVMLSQIFPLRIKMGFNPV